MMKRIILLAAALFAAVYVFGQDLSLFEKKEISKGEVVMPYRILYPENMEAGRQYPLFVFLHGMGKRGTDNEKQLDRGGKLFVDPANRKAFTCIAIYPQAPMESPFVGVRASGHFFPGGFMGWSKSLGSGTYADATTEITPIGELVLDLIHSLIDSGVVDTNRIYLAGASMGAYSTYHFIAYWPELFAAAAPMGGGADMRLIDNWAGKVPVWIVHGAKDETVLPENDRQIAAVLEEKGVEYKYTEYPDAGHNCWDWAFQEPDFLQWFFSHSKDGKTLEK